MLKASFYNILLPIPERNEYILYNTLYGGYTVLFNNEGQFWERLMNDNNFFSLSGFPENQEFLEKLIEGKYIVSSELDEMDLYKEHYFKRKDKLFYSGRARLILTIAPTNDCNMACPYCFEFKKSGGIMEKETIDNIIPFLENVIKSSKDITNWESLSITWYGGEPLLAPSVINDLSNKLIHFAEQNDMKYTADIVTNGLMLTNKNWEMLKKQKVNVVQVTVDGPKKIHDISRPVKDKTLPNYETIMKNLTNVPEGLRITFRINVDKDVAENIDELLDDLERLKIWPNKAKQMSLTAAWKRTYKERGEKNVENRFTQSEFSLWEQEFRENKLRRYNRWAQANNLPPAKLKWELPTLQMEECWTVISPYNFVIDSRGNIHKCWETIQEVKDSIQNISEPYEISKFQNKKILDYDRFQLTKDNPEFYNKNCPECKYFPICSEPSCTQYATNNRIVCEFTINKINSILKDQYLIWVENPDKIDFEKNVRERSCLV